VANGRHIKTRIFELEEGNPIIKGDEALKEYITEYYKRLAGLAECTDFSLNENMRNDLT
jgi:hypothetical protein